MLDEWRVKIFNNAPDARISLNRLDEPTRKKTRMELELVDCSTCYDHDCVYRDSKERLPQDAGGRGQCLRWAEWAYSDNPFFWRNPGGDIIVIPPEIIEAIRNKRKTVQHNAIETQTISHVQAAMIRSMVK